MQCETQQLQCDMFVYLRSVPPNNPKKLCGRNSYPDFRLFRKWRIKLDDDGHFIIMAAEIQDSPFLLVMCTHLIKLQINVAFLIN